MKLLFKQRFFSLFGRYEIYDESYQVKYIVQGQLSIGRSFIIYDKNNIEVAELKQRIFTFLPRYEMYLNGNYVGDITKEFSFFAPRFTMNYFAYSVDGDFFGLNYSVFLGTTLVARLSKEIFNLVDTYVIDVVDPSDELKVLMLAVAIDAIKESASNNHNHH